MLVEVEREAVARDNAFNAAAGHLIKPRRAQQVVCGQCFRLTVEF